MMLRIIDDLESLTDDCYSVAVLIKRSVEKKMEFATEDMERLDPYMELVQHFLEFIKENINKPLDAEKLRLAEVMEDQIDMFRKNLKKIARKRLEEGANVKAELLYLDVIRHIEKMGDHAFSISESLSQTQ
jgi:phosphate:Na+ symporter